MRSSNISILYAHLHNTITAVSITRIGLVCTTLYYRPVCVIESLCVINNFDVLFKGWATYGPRDHFMRPASSCRNINRSSDDVKTFFLLFTDVCGGKQIICRRGDLFYIALRRYPSNNPAQEGLRLPTYGPPTKVAHPCYSLLCKALLETFFFIYAIVCWSFSIYRTTWYSIFTTVIYFNRPKA